MNEMEQKRQNQNDMVSQNNGKKRALESKLYAMGAPESQKTGLTLKPNNNNTNAFKVAALTSTQRNRQSPTINGGDNSKFMTGNNKSQEGTDDENSPNRM